MTRQRKPASLRCAASPGAMERNQQAAERLLDVPMVLVAGPPGETPGPRIERMDPEACARARVGMSVGGGTMRA